ncbi:hypothetical protein V6N11_062380 [Hibiscus sabdariffa]|uniref:Uncharacterized protein n=1 Tax=Hibiscus sabdariffa TaxID=183260 RepID=A0ABR2PSK3_9ROSI
MSRIEDVLHVDSLTRASSPAPSEMLNVGSSAVEVPELSESSDVDIGFEVDNLPARGLTHKKSSCLERIENLNGIRTQWSRD